MWETILATVAVLYWISVIIVGWVAMARYYEDSDTPLFMNAGAGLTLVTHVFSNPSDDSVYRRLV